MKCPKCGTYNGKNNKFCRECGLHLAWVVEDDNLQAEIASEEIALGAKLAEIYDCFESGDLDAALSEAEKIVRDNPNSTSAYGVLALIYERKGETELDANNPEAARNYLELALSSYERIVTLNPGSVADREKLNLLRMKLKGKKKQVRSIRWQIARVVSLVKTAPPQAIAAGITFILILGLLVVLLPAKHRPVKQHSKYTVTKLPEASTQNQVSTSATPASGLKIYTFPAPTGTGTSTTPSTPVSSLTSKPPSLPQRMSSEVKPAKLPPIANELTIAPEAKKQEKAKAKVEPVGPKHTASPKPAAESKGDSAPRVDGTSLLANAIQLRNQGRTSEAISSAQQAINHFQSEASSGNNPTAAQRGMENARKLISLWQQSGN